jgi:hypothetical protein
MVKERPLLYEKHGKPMEEQHVGEYVAIALDRRTILGKSSGEALKRAIEAFGSGNFVLARIGHRTVGKWLSLAN